MLNWLRSIDWLAIAATAIVLVVVLAFLPPPQERTQTQNQPSNSPYSYVDPRSPDERVADYTLWLERFNGLLTIVAAVQIFLLFRAETIGRVSADASTKAANAAVLAQRPWIKLEAFIASGFVKTERGLRLEITAKLTNTGNTPATEVEAWATLACGGNGINYRPALERIPPRRERTGHSIFPNDFTEQSLFGTLLEEEIDAAKPESYLAGRIRVGLVVSVTYSFEGGIGETNRLYTVDTTSLMHLVNVDSLPSTTDLSLDPLPFRDTAS